MNLNSTASFLISAISIVIILIYGQFLLVPFILALLLWVLVRDINHKLDRIKLIKKYFPKWLKSVITSIFILSIMGAISKVLTVNISSLTKNYPLYETNVGLMTQTINETFNINIIEQLNNFSGGFDMGKILSAIFSSITDLFSSTFMILIYALFIFLEETSFDYKLKAVFTKEDQLEKVRDMLDRIESSVTKYLGLKVLLSFITGFASYLALMMIGIDGPIFWAFLIFLLNFIPTIGSLIATIFPAIFSLLQFGDFTHGTLVLVVVGLIQVLVGNILEPKMMGNSLNLSALVTIIALSFWGAIWGVVGMIISVPITVILVIIMSQFESSRGVAMMLSEKGKLIDEEA